MQREDAVTWGVVDDNDADEDARAEADAGRVAGARAFVDSLGGTRRLRGGALGLVGLGLLLVGAYTVSNPVILSVLFVLAPALLLLAVFGFLRGGDLVDTRI